MPARALVEIYWPTLHSASLLETFTFADLITGSVYCKSQSHECFSEILRVFFVMPLMIMNRNKGVASCDVLSFDIIALIR